MEKEEAKVKVVLTNHPDKVRWVTKAAAEYLKPKWQLADDQGNAPAQEAKKKVVAPAVEDKKPGLREDYKKLTGKDADPVWNEARLFVEIEKVKKNPPAKVEPPIQPEVEEEIPAIAPKKRGRKPKAVEA